MPRPPHLRSCGALLTLLLLFFSCVCVLSVTAGSANSGEKTAQQQHTTYHQSSSNLHLALCPSGPICSRAHTPLARKFKYCNRVTSFVSSFFSTSSSSSSSSSSKKIDRRHFPLQLPFSSDLAMRQQAKADLENLLLMRLIGQDHLQEELLDVLFKKLYLPSTPLVLHFAGDNGVGKSYTAKLISLALSLRCAGDSPDHGGSSSGESGCEAGDALLTISGTAYDGEPIPQARARIVEQVTAFSARHPHGVVLLDDVTAMEPELVTSLAPLLGRAAYFPDQLFVNTTDATAAQEPKLLKRVGPSLRDLLVIVTTDFGKQGRTVGLTMRQIRTMVLEEFSDLYGSLVPTHTRTFVYVPFSEQTAVQVVHATVDYLPCQLLLAAGGAAALGTSEMDAEAAQFLVKKYEDVWRGKENGHALRRAIEDEVLTPLLLAMDELQHQQQQQQQPQGSLQTSVRSQRKGRAKGRVVAAGLWDPAAPVDVRFFLDESLWRICFSLTQHGEVVYTTGSGQSGSEKANAEDDERADL